MIRMPPVPMRRNFTYQGTDHIEVVGNDIVLNSGGMRDRLERTVNRPCGVHLVITHSQDDAALVFDRQIAPAANGQAPGSRATI